MEFYKSVHEARLIEARAAVQAGLYINGLAATAVLAFLGSVAPKIEAAHLQHAHTPRAFVWSLGFFAVGVLLAALASVFSYLANHNYAEATSPWNVVDTCLQKRITRRASIAHTGAYLACAGMLLAFLAGATAAIAGFDRIG